MGAEVIDTNVLVLATAMQEGWTRPTIPTDDPVVLRRVYEWVKAFRQDPERHLTVDVPRRMVTVEYRQNLRHEHYGMQVYQHKWDANAVAQVETTYWANGFEWVADLPPEIQELVHDLGDHKMIACAVGASAPIVNAADGDWDEPRVTEALAMLDVCLVQLLTPAERAACKTRGTNR